MKILHGKQETFREVPIDVTSHFLILEASLLTVVTLASRCLSISRVDSKYNVQLALTGSSPAGICSYDQRQEIRSSRRTTIKKWPLESSA
jgi:hypothetical protein